MCQFRYRRSQTNEPIIAVADVHVLHYRDPLKRPTAAIDDVLTPDDQLQREISSRALLLHMHQR